MKLDHVFSPGIIGSLKLKNRLVVSAMSSHMGNGDGTPNEVVARYHERKAQGGWGLVFTEDLGVTRDAGSDPHVGSLWTDEQIPAWAGLVARVHACGAKMGAQIYHAGRERALAAYDTQPVAPSAVADPAMGYVPRELTIDEIRELVRAFGQAARRAKEAGFDIVEIHGAHGYLVNEFMSPFANKRTDEYGGTPENRMRFALEIVASVREAVGPDFPVSFRMNSCDYVPGGITLADAVLQARMLEEAGIDVLHVSQGVFTSKQHIIPPSYLPHMAYVDNARAIRRAVGVPVIAVGRYNDVCEAESSLRDGACDFVAMARASLADPDLPIKAEAGRLADINHCIGCNQGCTGHTSQGLPIGCMVNPLIGHEAESEFDLAPVDQPKRVLVAGAGVSGLSAALAASLKGHDVAVYEATDEVGGQWLAAGATDGKADYLAYVTWMRHQLAAREVPVLLGTPLTREAVERKRPDVVVVATGSVPVAPRSIEGLGDPALTVVAQDVLRCRAAVGGHVVVAGGGMTGLECAIFLAEQGASVDVVEMAPEVLTDAVSQPKVCLLEEIERYGVRVHTSTRMLRVEKGAVHAEKDGEAVVFSQVDGVVNALGVRPNDLLAGELADIGTRVVITGDAHDAKNGYRNIHQAFEVGLTL